MKWSILIAGLSHRPWQKIVEQLRTQARTLNNVEVLTYIDDGQFPSGLKRHILMEMAKGDYICYIDDDDKISNMYIPLIYSALRNEPDVVTFNLKFRRKDRVHKSENWSFGLHGDDRKSGKMMANHLCVWKRSIASRVSWCPSLGYGDDQLWYKPLVASQLTWSWYHIPDTLYTYQFDPSGTQNQTSPRIEFARNYFGDGLRAFERLGKTGKEIFIEVPHQPDCGPENVWVRDCNNRVQVMPLSSLQQYYLVELK